MVKKTLLSAVIAAAVGGLPLQASAQTAASAKQAIAGAKAAVEKAASVDGEWRDSMKILGKAQEALDDKAYGKAERLAEVVEQQGDLGYQQAMRQKNAAHPTYLK